jgi:uroporphyrinogen decarboxylase
MGLEYQMLEQKGPWFEKTIRSEEGLKYAETNFDIEDRLGYVLDAIRLTSKELDGRVPLIGFAGAPWTIFCYMVEGKGSKTFSESRKLLYTNPILAHELLNRITDVTIQYLKAQVKAGAHMLQVFDSWAGALSRNDYDKYVKPHTTSVFSQLAERHPGVAGIHYGIGCDHLLESMNSVGNAIIGLDWRTSIRNARTRLGADTVVQGNLDPALVLAGSSIALSGAEAVLADNAGHAGHIFNLGHGVQPDTDPSVLTDIVAYVHEKTTK